MFSLINRQRSLLLGGGRLWDFFVWHISAAQIPFLRSDINLLDINPQPPTVCFLGVNELKKEMYIDLILIFKPPLVKHIRSVLTVI